MTKQNCTNCGKSLPLSEDLTQCPHCEAAIVSQEAIAEDSMTIQVDQMEMEGDGEFDDLDSDFTQSDPEESDDDFTLSDDTEATPESVVPMETMETPDIIASVDTAKTMVSGTAQVPTNSIGDRTDQDQGNGGDEAAPLSDSQRSIGGSSRTIDSAGRSPLLGDYSATLKPTESAFNSVDLSSAIPPRAIAAWDAPHGEAQDYRLGEKLGSGSFGVVYKAEQVPLQRTVALKMLKFRKRAAKDQSEDSRSRLKSQRVKDRNEFLREAQFTGKLEHPNIVPVHDIGLFKDKEGVGNRPFYVMKEIKGDSWQSKMKVNTRAENLEILRRVAEAIEYSHDKNVLHCDLKPENVMLGEFGEVLVVDWGQAVDISKPETFRPGGSPAYISPEMATYWCDVFLDEKPDDEVRKDITQKSDIYLLGAMLFEIVAGRPPHFGLKGETAFDVMRRATENQICKHEQFMDDELMQIARRTLRLDENVSFETVGEFLDALKEYETRRVSIELRDRAMRLLDEAKEKKDYDAFGKARFGFEEAIEKWDANQPAREGLSDARLSCAELALHDQNFDLGIGMLEDPETDQEVTLRKKLVTEKTKRDRRKRMVGFLSVLLLCGGVGSVGLIAWGIQQTRTAVTAIAKADVATKEAEQAKTVASVAKEEATVAIKVAEKEKQNAELAIQEAKDAQREKTLALMQKMELDEQFAIARENFDNEQMRIQGELDLQQQEVKRQEELAEMQTQIAREQEREAERQKQEASRQAQIASEARQRNRLLKYRDAVVQTRTSVLEGDFATATQLLSEVEEKDQASVEWGRLRMLTHPESTEFPRWEAPLTYASSSRNGRLIAMLTETEVRICEASDFAKTTLRRPVENATVVALSPDGSAVAVGSPATVTTPAKIVVWEGGKSWVINNVPSVAMTDLQFSEDGNLLLCVGRVNRIRKSVGLEKELMVYRKGSGGWLQRDLRGDPDDIPLGNDPVSMVAQQIAVKLTVGSDAGGNAGVQPKFTNASFSQDGRRILLTSSARNVGVRGGKKPVHVFELADNTYRWVASPRSDAIDAAIFADDAGNRVVGCVTDQVTSLCGMFIWEVPSARSSSAGANSGLEIEPFRQLTGRVRSMHRKGQTLVTGGTDRKVSMWNLENQELIGSWAGHSKAVDLCTFIPGERPEDSTLVSLASIGTGERPELLRNNLGKRIDDRVSVRIGDSRSQSSPMTLSVSRDNQQWVIGGQDGHVVVRDGVKNTEWEVGAWQNHVLADDYLFAQTGRDHFLRYDRKTGEIKDVLRRLSQQDETAATRIVKFQVSDDGKTALIETNPHGSEFQIWNLETQTLIKRLRYGYLFPESGSESSLPEVALSPDGTYVVAGKVGLIVWSTQPGFDTPVYQNFGGNRDVSWPRNPIGSIVFFEGEGGNSEFAVTWPEASRTRGRSSRTRAGDDSEIATGRIHVYQKQPQSIQLVGRFRASIAKGAFDTGRKANQPNAFAARTIDGQRYIVVRASRSLDLLKLTPGIADPAFSSNAWDAFEKVRSFKDAKFAAFSKRNTDLLILNKDASNPVQRYSLAEGQVSSLPLSSRLETEFAEFPRQSLDAIGEAADGSMTVQSIVKGEYNTATLSQGLEVAGLRVLARPPVTFAAATGDVILTQDGGSLRKWQLVANPAAGGPGSQNDRLVQPAGSLPGFFDFCSLSPDGKKLLACERGSHLLTVVESGSGNLMFEIEAGIEARPTAATWSDDGARLVVGFETGELRVFNVNESTAAKAADHPYPGDGPVEQLALDAAGTTLLAIFADGPTTPAKFAHVYHQQGGDAVGEWNSVVIGDPDGQRLITTGAISEDGQRVITGARSGQLTFWNVSVVENAVTGDPRANRDLQQIAQRELFDLGEMSSAVRFVDFVGTTESGGIPNVFSADIGSGNQMQVWRTAKAQ